MTTEGSTRCVVSSSQTEFRDTMVVDVALHQEKNKVGRASEVSLDGIEGVGASSSERENVDYGGEISWESLELAQRAKVRFYIVGVALLLWMAWTIVGLVVFVRTGNALLLVGSPALMGLALYRILSSILKYYFPSDVFTTTPRRSSLHRMK